VLPATRQRWHSCSYPSRSWYLIKRPRRDARLSWPSWLVTYRDGIPTHPGTNRAWRALTSFMRRTPLATTPCRQLWSVPVLNVVLCWLRTPWYWSRVWCSQCMLCTLRLYLLVSSMMYDNTDAVVKNVARYWWYHSISRHFCLTVLIISYVDSYRDIDSYVIILPSLLT